MIEGRVGAGPAIPHRHSAVSIRLMPSAAAWSRMKKRRNADGRRRGK